jgi:hypothetical protein
MQDMINGFFISLLMQELMTYAGHLDSYGKNNEILERFLSVAGSILLITPHFFKLPDLSAQAVTDKKREKHNADYFYFLSHNK